MKTTDIFILALISIITACTNQVKIQPIEKGFRFISGYNAYGDYPGDSWVEGIFEGTMDNSTTIESPLLVKIFVDDTQLPRLQFFENKGTTATSFYGAWGDALFGKLTMQVGLTTGETMQIELLVGDNIANDNGQLYKLLMEQKHTMKCIFFGLGSKVYKFEIDPSAFETAMSKYLSQVQNEKQSNEKRKFTLPHPQEE